LQKEKTGIFFAKKYNATKKVAVFRNKYV